MRSLASEVIAKIGPRLGLTVNLEPQYRYVGQIITADGRKFYFRNTNFDLNGQGAAEMAKDKDYAAYFMRLLGYRVPEGETFYSNDWCRVLQSPRDIVTRDKLFHRDVIHDWLLHHALSTLLPSTLPLRYGDFLIEQRQPLYEKDTTTNGPLQLYLWEAG